MKYLLFLVVLVAVAFFLRHRREVLRKRRERHVPPIECTRAFHAGSDPFDPNERIEFYLRKKG